MNDKATECGCTISSLTKFIREHSADCKITDRKNKRSDEFIACAIQYAIQAVVTDKSDDFQKVVEIKLENGTCIQTACEKCSGIVDMVGNINGDCDDPVKEEPEEREKNAFYSRYYAPIKCADDTSEDQYKITKFRVLGDGGCQFKVEPIVPAKGDYYVNILCVVMPDTSDGNIPPELCRYIYLVVANALFWVYTFDADPAQQIKAQVFLKAYNDMLTIQREINRDVFVESIKFGTRVGTDEQ